MIFARTKGSLTFGECLFRGKDDSNAKALRRKMLELLGVAKDKGGIKGSYQNVKKEKREEI